jgi:uroporphyrinogen decarboxylase
MEYRPVDRVPNWEAGTWPQTVARWKSEGMPYADDFLWWFWGDERFGFDPREFTPLEGNFVPRFEEKLLETTERHTLWRDLYGITRKALNEPAIGGARMSMDEYIDFPVKTRKDWEEIKKRLRPAPSRSDLSKAKQWLGRTHPLILGENCATLGFYWIARQLMGTENLCYAWYDQPELLHDMMEHWANFLIEIMKPVLAVTTIDYICINEDMSMKNGPLLSPDTYKEFIFPRFKRVVEFCKGHGVRYVNVDTDGNPEALSRPAAPGGHGRTSGHSGRGQRAPTSNPWPVSHKDHEEEHRSC